MPLHVLYVHKAGREREGEERRFTMKLKVIRSTWYMNVTLYGSVFLIIGCLTLSFPYGICSQNCNIVEGEKIYNKIRNLADKTAITFTNQERIWPLSSNILAAE